jgi:hypothetical protein
LAALGGPRPQGRGRGEAGRRLERLSRNGEAIAAHGIGEYPDIYAEFARLIDGKTSHVDVAPLRLTADAFLAGKRELVERFDD